MKKYINRSYFCLAIIFSLLAGLEIPFNTITYSYIFYLISKKSVSLIIPSVTLIILGYAVFAVLGYTKSVIVNKNIYLINSKLKENFLISKMANVTEEQENFESGNLSFFLNDLKLLEDNYWRQIFALLGSIVMTIGTLTYALYSNVYITIIFLLFMIIPTLAPKLFTKSIQAKTDTWSQNNQILSSTVKDLLHGALLLRRYNVTGGFSKRMNRSISEMESSNASLKNQIALSNSVIGMLFSTFSYLPIGLGIYFTITGRITLAQFVAIQYSSSWILNGFNQIITSWNTISSTKSIRTKIHQLKPLKVIASTEKAVVMNKLSANDISFNYNQKQVFHDVSFSVTQGEKILIGGKSGIGKSTLIRMILQELQPTTGKLLFNNHSYSQVDSYNNFGIVGQTPIIFEDSLKNNITLGDDTADDQKVITALKQSGLEEFANETSLRMQINENGHNFSGGQLKRIEIARALYFNRQLLLIDEGTASLDPETATSIHESILNNKSLTIIEVDHHIPDEVKKLYDRVYELSNTGLALQN